jgi:serine-type D-Ala-D-Ala carboxypeptidase/endopeptidase (penicillin-binding protein 4)
MKLKQSLPTAITGLILLSAFSITNPAQAQTSTGGLCPTQMTTAVEAILNRPALQNSYWGIAAQQLNAAKNRPLLYSYNATKLFLPASNAKLLTTAVALNQLTPQFRAMTPFYSTGAAPTLKMLRVIGQGDPTITEQKLAQVAQQLSAQGVKRIETLVGVDTIYPGLPYVSSWQWEDFQSGDGAIIHGLMLYQNPDAAPISSPNTHFMQRLRSILQQRQIQVDRFSLVTARNSPLAAPSLTGETQVSAIEFPPLSQWIAEVNQESNNLYAEALLRRLGVTTSPTTSANEAGLAALQRGLTQFGASPSGYELADGSGLSRKNLVSPLTFLQTLQGVARSPYLIPFQESLAVAGKSGTLERRFLNTPVQGRLFGKTGTLKGVSSLSGYLYTSEPPLVFSVIANHSNQESAILRQATDEIVLLLSRLQSCGAT